MRSRSTPKGKLLTRRTLPADLASRILATMSVQRLAAKFIESYATQFGRAELIIHKQRNLELESILAREILLAMLARVAHTVEEDTKSRPRRRGEKNNLPEPNRLIREVVAAIGQERGWTAGDIVEILGEFDLYRAITAKNSAPIAGGSRFGSSFRRGSNAGPFVDRCAFVLDASMMENARVSAAKTLREIELLADQLLEESIRAMGPSDSLARRT